VYKHKHNTVKQFLNLDSAENKGYASGMYPRVPLDHRCSVEKLNCVRHLRPLGAFPRLLVGKNVLVCGRGPCPTPDSDTAFSLM